MAPGKRCTRSEPQTSSHREKSVHLLPHKLIFGVAPEILLDCARQLHDQCAPSFSLEDFCQALGAPVHEALPVLQSFVAEGLAVPAPIAGVTAFTPTAKFSQLALAQISEGISRVQADQFVLAVIEKAKAINADPTQYPCAVQCLAIFGSYLGNKATLGDLDIAVQLDRPRWPEGTTKADIWRLIQGRRQSPSLKSLVALRLRKPKYLSIHTMEEMLGLGTPYKVVFGHLGDPLHGAAPSRRDAPPG